MEFMSRSLCRETGSLLFVFIVFDAVYDDGDYVSDCSVLRASGNAAVVTLRSWLNIGLLGSDGILYY